MAGVFLSRGRHALSRSLNGIAEGGGCGFDVCARLVGAVPDRCRRALRRYLNGRAKDNGYGFGSAPAQGSLGARTRHVDNRKISILLGSIWLSESRPPHYATIAQVWHDRMRVWLGPI